MMNFLNEHFGALSALFILTLLIVSEWKNNPSSKLINTTKVLRYPRALNLMLFWIKIMVLLQSLILLFSILNYFQ